MEATKLIEEHKEKIQELRERVAGILTDDKNDDNYLIKWLIARRFDVDKAEEMLRKHIRFVKINGLNNFSEDFMPCKAARYFHTAMLGYDKEGSVVRILNLGATDLRGTALSVSQTDSIRIAASVLFNDAARQKRERPDAICEKQVYIIDLQGMSWRSVVHRPVAERALVLLKNYEANYPERLKVAFIVNAPSFFSSIYNWMKSFLPDSVIMKVQILSEEDRQSILTKLIDGSILPASVGGFKRDPDGDPNCSSLYLEPLGVPVPENLYLSNQFVVLENDPDAKKTFIECRSLFKVENLINEPNSILEWDFQTVYYDIRMGLNYKPGENSPSEEIIPAHRIESHRIPESGKFTCEKSGIYEIVFDNTYSWMTRKELIYKIVVSLPDKSNVD